MIKIICARSAKIRVIVFLAQALQTPYFLWNCQHMSKMNIHSMNIYRFITSMLVSSCFSKVATRICSMFFPCFYMLVFCLFVWPFLLLVVCFGFLSLDSFLSFLALFSSFRYRKISLTAHSEARHPHDRPELAHWNSCTCG